MHLQWCDFVVWSPHDIFVQRIKYNPGQQNGIWMLAATLTGILAATLTLWVATLSGILAAALTV